MGFLDKVKEQGSALAAKAQEGVKQGQAKLDEGQARKKVDAELRDLGSWLWAQKNGRDDGRGETEVARLLGELSAYEAEHGPLALPATPPPPGELTLENVAADQAAPAPPAAAAPAPPAEAPAAPAPPPAAATPPPPAPAPPAGGFTLEDM